MHQIEKKNCQMKPKLTISRRLDDHKKIQEYMNFNLNHNFDNLMSILKKSIKDQIERKTFYNLTSELTIREVLKSIPNGKSPGFANISGEILKIAPYLFNIGIIKPIVKDFKSDPNDIVNLRPITVSDILVRLVLILSQVNQIFDLTKK
ncbi:hypothetical protein BpHYR1_007252 [Brachionus plicatilis]|uniref:RNA-directed DNA polymerase from mobile element jockey-like n=1 Tax=Brachionus plicatilis TaxID=10195 RepID=A0A3M7T7X1_BRAPC|nr:hypothetical protein BpHYR1_007252 [Brachionus plicatilis]